MSTQEKKTDGEKARTREKLQGRFKTESVI